MDDSLGNKDVTVSANDLLQVLESVGTKFQHDAIKRLTDAYNQEYRKPMRDKPTSEQLNIIMDMFAVYSEYGSYIRPWVSVSPGFVKTHRSLLSDGWIEFGVRSEEIIWTMSAGEKTRQEFPAPACRLTDRGRYSVNEEVERLQEAAREAQREEAKVT